MLVRAGRFRRQTLHGPTDLDRTVGYLGPPGEQEQFAHPHGGDVCTSLQMSAAVWRQLMGDVRVSHSATFHVDARADLAHRRLLAAGADDVEYELAEDLLRLLATALRGGASRPAPTLHAPGQFDRRLVERARAAIHDGHPAAGGLFSLADHLGCSPYRLSRAFPRELGVTLTRYRNGFRVGRALDALERDESSLADVANSLGFADQAHFTRVVREHLGCTPSEIRPRRGLTRAEGSAR